MDNIVKCQSLNNICMDNVAKSQNLNLDYVAKSQNLIGQCCKITKFKWTKNAKLEFEQCYKTSKFEQIML